MIENDITTFRGFREQIDIKLLAKHPIKTINIYCYVKIVDLSWKTTVNVTIKY